MTLIEADTERVEGLKRVKLSIYEVGLGEFMVRDASRPRFTTELQSVARESDVVFISVSTPPGRLGGLL